MLGSGMLRAVPCLPAPVHGGAGTYRLVLTDPYGADEPAVAWPPCIEAMFSRFQQIAAWLRGSVGRLRSARLQCGRDVPAGKGQTARDPERARRWVLEHINSIRTSEVHREAV